LKRKNDNAKAARVKRARVISLDDERRARGQTTPLIKVRQRELVLRIFPHVLAADLKRQEEDRLKATARSKKRFKMHESAAAKRKRLEREALVKKGLKRTRWGLKRVLRARHG
jgi:hypothetical protein